MPKIKHEVLEQMANDLFTAVGVPEKDAKIVSNALVLSNLKGHDSHGVRLIPLYLGQIKNGKWTPGAKIETIKETDSIEIINGNWNLGQVLTELGMKKAMEKAKKVGISYVGIYNCAHICRVGRYVEPAAENDMIGILISNCGLGVPAYGGITMVQGTNPIAVGIPAGKERPIILDMATSTHAEGVIGDKKERGEKIPLGWLIDSEGKPTSDPNDISEGGMVEPFGGVVGYKGFGLSLIVDVIGGILNGTGISINQGVIFEFNGISIICIDIASIMPVKSFKAQVDELISKVRSAPIREGAQAIEIPGHRAAKAEEIRRKEGIFIPEMVWNTLTEVSEECGLNTLKYKLL